MSEGGTLPENFPSNQLFYTKKCICMSPFLYVNEKCVVGRLEEEIEDVHAHVEEKLLHLGHNSM